MNNKHLLAIGLFATMFTACSQEELITPGEKVDLGNRPTIGSPIFDFEAGTRMGVNVDGAFNAIKWEEGVDGIGACIIDEADLTQTAWEDKYTVVDYISSNYQYLRKEGSFATTALMVEGNYMFYAPYDGEHLTRNAISINMPTVQNVTKEMPNKAIDELYKSNAPALIGYLPLKAEGQTGKIEVNMRHIFAYPQFTLKNSYTEGTKPTNITVTKVEFSKTGDFTVKAPIQNTKVVDVLDETKADNWFDKEIETAATSDILNTTGAVTADKITVMMGEGIEIAAGESFAFNVVLPAEDYLTNKIKATVYTSDNKKFDAVFTAGGMFLNPGKRFPAKEYNTDGSLKESKGTLATLELKGNLVDAGTPAVSSTGIKYKKDFIAYLANIATRYRDLKQVNDKFIELNTAAKDEATGGNTIEVYDEGIHFTLADDANLVIDNEVINALDNYIHVGESGAGSVTFLTEDVNAGKVVIGNAANLGGYKIEFTGVATDAGNDPNKYVTLATSGTPTGLEISGDVTLKGDCALTAVTIPSGSTLTLAADLEPAANLAITNDGGTIVWNGGTVTSITNTKGTLNINEDVTSTSITVSNTGITNIAANVSVGAAVTNNANGVINNSGFMYGTNGNSGTINVKTKAATTSINSGTGTIINDVLGAVAVTGGTQTVKYTETKHVIGKLTYADATGINYVVLTAGWSNPDFTVDANTALPTTIEFAGGIFTTPTTIDFSSVGNGDIEGLIFSENTEWFGNATTKPTVTNVKVTVNADKVLTLKHITVEGAVGSTAVGEQINDDTNAEYTVAP